MLHIADTADLYSQTQDESSHEILGATQSANDYEKQMPGNQPAKQLILEESDVYSKQHLLISTGSSNLPPIMNLITKAVENSTLLADVIVRNITENKYSSSIPTLSIESLNEAKVQALMANFQQATHNAKKWEQPKSKTTNSFLDNWMTRIAAIIGGLTGVLGVAAGIGRLVYHFKQRQNNHYTNEEEERTIPLNSSSNNMENGKEEINSNSINYGECVVPLFQVNERGEEGGSESPLHASLSGWSVKNKLEKKIKYETDKMETYV